MSSVDYIDKTGNIRKGELKQKTGKTNPSRFASVDVVGTMMMPVILGVFIGYYIDKWLGKQSMFTILGLSLGIITVIYNFYKLTKKNGR